MNKLLKAGNIIVICIALIVFVVIIGCNNYFYHNIFHMDVFLPSGIVMITNCIIAAFKQSSNNRTKIILSSILILVITITAVLFLWFKPHYSVNEAIDTIQNDSGITDIELDGTMSVTPRSNTFVSDGYVFSGLLESKAVTVIFNPVTGEYDAQEY